MCTWWILERRGLEGREKTAKTDRDEKEREREKQGKKEQRGRERTKSAAAAAAASLRMAAAAAAAARERDDRKIILGLCPLSSPLFLVFHARSSVRRLGYDIPDTRFSYDWLVFRKCQLCLSPLQPKVALDIPFNFLYQWRLEWFILAIQSVSSSPYGCPMEKFSVLDGWMATAADELSLEEGGGRSWWTWTNGPTRFFFSEGKHGMCAIISGRGGMCNAFVVVSSQSRTSSVYPPPKKTE